MQKRYNCAYILGSRCCGWFRNIFTLIPFISFFELNNNAKINWHIFCTDSVRARIIKHFFLELADIQSYSDIVSDQLSSGKYCMG